MAKPNVVLEQKLNSSEPLNPKMERLIALTLADDPNDPEAGPMDVYSAGRHCGYQRKAIRTIIESPIFVATQPAMLSPSALPE
jgi:hypothetical protein